MKEYRLTLTINIFIPAESEQEAQDLYENMSMEFTDCDTGRTYLDTIIDDEITEVID